MIVGEVVVVMLVIQRRRNAIPLPLNGHRRGGITRFFYSRDDQCTLFRRVSVNEHRCCEFSFFIGFPLNPFPYSIGYDPVAEYLCVCYSSATGLLLNRQFSYEFCILP